jgi:hypothetical protein
MSWVEDKAAEVIEREGLSPLAGAAFLAGIRETVEEAAGRCDQAHARDIVDNGTAATGAARDARERVLAMLGKTKP